MSITAISYDWGVQPTMVRITTDATYAEVTAAGYWPSQSDVVNALNKGIFEFPEGSLIAISYSGGQNTFTYNASIFTFVPSSHADTGHGDVEPAPYQ